MATTSHDLAAAEPDARTCDAPVAEVTLCEDRAHVVRHARVPLAKGRTRLRIAGVAPVLADKTLVAVLTGGAGVATVDDVRVTRRVLPPPDRPEPVRDLERRRDESHRELERLNEDRERLEARIGQWTETLDLALREMARDVAWSVEPDEAWRTRHRASVATLDRLHAERLDFAHRAADLEERIMDLDRRIAAGSTGAGRRVAWVDLDVTVAAEGPHELRLEYVVPGACWRPAHVARLVTAGATPALEWACHATAWQATGEDWTDVALRFSTQRPTLGAEPPQLGSDVLALTTRAPTLTVEAREEKIQTTGPAGSRTAAEVPGVDDGGETRTLKGAARATLPSDGRPYRVPLFAFTAAADVSWVTMPELAAAVLQKCTAKNGAPHPILAGPVELRRDSGTVGRTSVLFVAPGAPFELGFGPDPEVRVRREVEEVVHERGMLGAWDGREQRVRLRFSNLAATPKSFAVRERVPVSEVEKVKIEPDPKHSSGGAIPDADGFVQWRVTLPPFAGEKLELRYTIRSHKDVSWG